MIQLLVIADDFTGALDTGVKFAEKGIRTRVIVNISESQNWMDILNTDKTDVLVIDTETRHIEKERAYEKVHSIVSTAKQIRLPYVYKKTDSALRGNIGSELTAAYDALDEKYLAFIPAFPKMKRFTKKGKQFIDGTPVSESVFGHDPFDPVTADSVKDIIRQQSDISVTEVFECNETNWEQPGILVFDSSTQDDIRRTAQHLKNSGNCRLLAGCAGFAEFLPELLDLEEKDHEQISLEKNLFVVCGSVNPITVSQMDFGEKSGYLRMRMTAEQKLNRQFADSEQGMDLIRHLLEESQKNDCVILDSNDPKHSLLTLDYAREKNLSIEQVRITISETIGMLIHNLLKQGLHAVLLVTGGDTLLGLMKRIQKWELQPIREISPGCVLTKLCYNNQEYHIITKSGGFGEANLLSKLVEKIRL